jgi:hypothetical protein
VTAPGPPLRARPTLNFRNRGTVTRRVTIVNGGKRARRLAAARLYREILDTDSHGYGGGNVGRAGAMTAEHAAHHGLEFSLSLTLPPLPVF